MSDENGRSPTGTYQMVMMHDHIIQQELLLFLCNCALFDLWFYLFIQAWLDMWLSGSMHLNRGKPLWLCSVTGSFVFARGLYSTHVRTLFAIISVKVFKLKNKMG